ncbi:MAG: tetratricopeptide repeat protein [Candidatus Obscuribacterales bacterium]|nr:tetratricopeptide repeat protein [Candidatus Obscuribacterales bacterium]
MTWKNRPQSPILVFEAVLATALSIGCGIYSSAQAQASALDKAASGMQANGQSNAQQAIGMYNLGLTAYKNQSLDAAIVFFRRATDLDPNLTDAQYNLGVLYQSQKRNKEAIARFQEVLRMKSTDPDAHYQMGLALMDMGRAAEAKTHFAFIAPTSSHFPDAQKRMQICDQQVAGATVAAPSYNYGANNPNANPAPTALNTQPLGTDGNAQLNMAGAQPLPQTYQAPPQQAYQAPPQQAYQAPPQQAYQTPPQLAYQAPPQQAYQAPPQQAYQVPPQQAYQAPPQQAKLPVSTPPASGGPVAVLANAQARVIATNFYAPSGLTFDKMGNLYVANFEKNTIDRISTDGTRMQFSAGTTLRGPIGLVCDDFGNVYVANYHSNTVVRISPAGVSTLIATNFKRPYYLALDKAGNLFVSQQEDNSIVRISLPKPVAAKPL